MWLALLAMGAGAPLKARAGGSQAIARALAGGGAVQDTLGAPVPASDPGYQFLLGLSRRGGLSESFPTDGQPLSRAQMAMYVSDAMDQATLPGAGGAVQTAQVPPMAPPPMPGVAASAGSGAYTYSPGDRQEVYRLVQQYQAELLKMGAKLDDLENRLVTLGQEKDDWSAKLDRLFRATGLSINGVAETESDDLLVLDTPNGARRFWPTVGYMDLSFTARPNNALYAQMVYRMEVLFGGYWGSLNVAGVRHFIMTANLPVSFSLGDVNYRNTPLTFWADQDSYPFENEILARKRREGMDQLYLGDHTWPLTGGTVSTTLLLFDRADLALTAMGARTAIAGSTNSGETFAVTYPYDQYYAGGHAVLSPDGSDFIKLGASYFELFEPVDSTSTVPLYPPQKNNVAGVDLEVNPAGNLSLMAEAAHSNYTPDYGGPLNWTQGNADEGHLAWKFGSKADPQKLCLSSLYVEQGFINYAAQTRVEDSYQGGGRMPLTSNVLYNPTTGGYGGPFGTGTTAISLNPEFFTQYNNVILATNQHATINTASLSQPGGVYLTYDPAVNNSLPYGDATPNRAGGALDYQGSFGGGFLKPRIFGSHYQEVVNAWYAAPETGTRTYNRGGAGFKLDLKSLGWPVKLEAGLTVEDTRSNSFVAYTSTQVDYGLEYDLTDSFRVLGGFQHRDWNGSDFFYLGQGSYQWYYQDAMMDVPCAGFEWKFSKSTDLYANYVYHDLIDVYHENTHTYYQEYDAAVRMEF